MTYKELRDKLNTLTEDQLTQIAAIWVGDAEVCVNLSEIEISGEDFYWEHNGDLIGTLDHVKETFGDSWESELDDLVIIPKGTVSLIA